MNFAREKEQLFWFEAWLQAIDRRKVSIIFAEKTIDKNKKVPYTYVNVVVNVIANADDTTPPL